MPAPSHIGVIKDTKPDPIVFFGSVTDIAKYLGVTYPTAYALCHQKGKMTSKGWRRVTDEEEVKYYIPPKPIKPRNCTYKERANWKVTFIKRGEHSIESKKYEDLFSGSIKELQIYLGLDRSSQIHKVLDSHYGISKGSPVKSVRGYVPYRIRKYSKPYKKRSWTEIRKQNKLKRA